MKGKDNVRKLERKAFLGKIITALFFLIIISPLMVAVTAQGAPPVPTALSTSELAALTPEQKLARVEALAAAAHFKATEALKTGNLVLAREAQDLINQASALDCDVSRHSASAQDPKLAQAALNASARIVETIDMLLAVAENIAGSSTDKMKVAAAKAFQLKATNAKKDILVCQKIALGAGASMPTVEAYEPPRRQIPLPKWGDREPASHT